MGAANVEVGGGGKGENRDSGGWVWWEGGVCLKGKGRGGMDEEEGGREGAKTGCRSVDR